MARPASNAFSAPATFARRLPAPITRRPGDHRAVRRRSGAALAGHHRQSWRRPRQPALDRILGMPACISSPSAPSSNIHGRHRGICDPQVWSDRFRPSGPAARRQCRPAERPTVSPAAIAEEEAAWNGWKRYLAHASPIRFLRQFKSPRRKLRSTTSIRRRHSWLRWTRPRLVHRRRDLLRRGWRGAPSGLARALPDGHWRGWNRNERCCWSAVSRWTRANSVPSTSSTAICPAGVDPMPLIEKYRGPPEHILERFDRRSGRSRRPALRNPGRALGQARDHLALLLPAQQPHLRRFLRRAHPRRKAASINTPWDFRAPRATPCSMPSRFCSATRKSSNEILRYTLKEVRADGSIPYGIVGHGVVVP